MMPYMNQNPNYYAQYLPNQQPYVNPYLQRLENLQQFQQTLQPQIPAIGKIVESIDIVKSTDIPMDGNMYYFPKADGTEVYGKSWLPNGQTRILTFKAVLEDNPNNVSSEAENVKIGALDEQIKAVLSDLRALNDKLDKLSKQEKGKKGGNDE